jgi:hypothetical protein
MDWIERALLIAIYPLLVASDLVDAIAGADPLRLREPKGSCWIERGSSLPASSYFLGRSSGRRAPMTTRALIVIGRLLHGRSATARAQSGDAEIPDEIYTLW